MTTTESASTVGLDTVAELAAQLRVDSVRSSTSAGSGHPTSRMSAADLLAVLVTRHLLYPAGEKFPVGGSKVLRSGDTDQVTLIGAGVTLHERAAAFGRTGL